MSNHIELHRLESRAWHCTVQTDGTAQDLGSCYLFFTVKKSYSYTDGQALFQLSIGSGITLTDTASGMYDLTIPATATSAVTKSGRNEQYFFDHRIQLPDGNVKVMEQGDFVVLPNVTDTVV